MWPEGRRLRASEPGGRKSPKSRRLESQSVLSPPPGHPPLLALSSWVGTQGHGWHQLSFLWGRLGPPKKPQAGIWETPVTSSASFPQTYLPSHTHQSSLNHPPTTTNLLAS